MDWNEEKRGESGRAEEKNSERKPSMCKTVDFHMKHSVCVCLCSDEVKRTRTYKIEWDTVVEIKKEDGKRKVRWSGDVLGEKTDEKNKIKQNNNRITNIEWERLYTQQTQQEQERHEKHKTGLLNTTTSTTTTTTTTMGFAILISKSAWNWRELRWVWELRWAML